MSMSSFAHRRPGAPSRRRRRRSSCTCRGRGRRASKTILPGDGRGARGARRRGRRRTRRRRRARRRPSGRRRRARLSGGPRRRRRRRSPRAGRRRRGEAAAKRGARRVAETSCMNRRPEGGIILRGPESFFGSVPSRRRDRMIDNRPMRVESAVLRHVEMPLKFRFRTSFGETTVKKFLLLELRGEGLSGWGECVAEEGPFYSPETLVDGGGRSSRRILLPLVLGKDVASPAAFDDLARRVRGNRMAKATVESALRDLFARAAGVPLGEGARGHARRDRGRRLARHLADGRRDRRERAEARRAGLPADQAEDRAGPRRRTASRPSARRSRTSRSPWTRTRPTRSPTRTRCAPSTRSVSTTSSSRSTTRTSWPTRRSRRR